MSAVASPRAARQARRPPRAAANSGPDPWSGLDHGRTGPVLHQMAGRQALILPVCHQHVLSRAGEDLSPAPPPVSYRNRVVADAGLASGTLAAARTGSEAFRADPTFPASRRPVTSLAQRGARPGPWVNWRPPERGAASAPPIDGRLQIFHSPVVAGQEARQTRHHLFARREIPGCSGRSWPHAAASWRSRRAPRQAILAKRQGP